MKPKKVLVNIDIKQIYPHPDNPRKDLGDLSELVESIKKNGIMQNLSVVPGHFLTDEEWKMLSKIYQEEPSEETRQLMNSKWSPEGYTLIIGHRRHAAAALADVKEVPCRIIEDMSKKEQVSTMLEENMQRNDLTIYEQAQGFQMMLDLGETTETIAEKTGFSKTTINHRLNIAKLNPEELKKKEEDESFQLTLTDLYELEKVKDIKTRNKILKEAYSSERMRYMARNAARDEQYNENEKKIIEQLKKLGVEKAPKSAENEQYSGKWDKVKEFDLAKEVPDTISLKNSKEPLYYVRWYSTLAVIRKAKPGEKKKSKYELEQEKRNRNKKSLKGILKEMNKVQEQLVRDIIAGKISAKVSVDELWELLWSALTKNGAYLYRSSLRNFIDGKTDYQRTDEEKVNVNKQISELSVINQMLIFLVRAMKDVDTYDWNGKYQVETAASLKEGLAIFELYGWSYQSDEERQIMDGISELYVKDEK